MPSAVVEKNVRAAQKVPLINNACKNNRALDSQEPI